ncbi:MAG TPA: zf-HC2 domain-containing protein, partial [Polyangiaceae bacterium]
MSCRTAVSSEDLSRYWSNDLPSADVDRFDEHLMGCEACSAESARIAAVAQAVRAFIPPVVTRALLEKLAREGMRIEENTFAPGMR